MRSEELGFCGVGMKKYCVSLELAKEMKELRFNQESLFYWIKWLDGDIMLKWKWEAEERKRQMGRCVEIYPAYTVGELGEMLPKRIEGGWLTIEKGVDKWGISYVWGNRHKEYSIVCDTESNARAKMLIYLKKEGII